MGLGLGIFLIVAGAILTFAVTASVEGVDLATIGIILMAAGALSLVMGLIMGAQRTHTSHKVTQRQAPDRRRPPYDE